MARLENIKTEIGITISDETAMRCCQILSMYLADNPDKTISVCGWNEDGRFQRSVIIARKKDRDAD